MKYLNRIVKYYLFALLLTQAALAGELDGVMSRINRESDRDMAAGMSHSHNANGTKRTKAEGRAISSTNRSRLNGSQGIRSSVNQSTKADRPLFQLYEEFKLYEGSKPKDDRRRTETCFTPDTLVIVVAENQTELVPIRDVLVGDKVLSCDPGDLEAGPKCAPRKVLAKSTSTAEVLKSIKLGAGELKVTLDHKFFVPQRGWISADDLQVGNKLWSDNGNLLEIEEIRLLEDFENPVEVYDLKVDAIGFDNCNYYVGADRVLVHNCDMAIAGLPESFAELFSDFGGGEDQDFCFGENTQVATDEGPRSIPDISEGDLVLSCKFPEGPQEFYQQYILPNPQNCKYERVLRTSKRTVENYWKVYIDQGYIEVTGNHRFFVPGLGYLSVDQIHSNIHLKDLTAYLFTKDGSRSKVEHFRKIEETVFVYDLTVENGASYFVASVSSPISISDDSSEGLALEPSQWVLAHNCGNHVSLEDMKAYADGIRNALVGVADPFVALDKATAYLMPDGAPKDAVRDVIKVGDTIYTVVGGVTTAKMVYKGGKWVVKKLSAQAPQLTKALAEGTAEVIAKYAQTPTGKYVVPKYKFQMVESGAPKLAKPKYSNSGASNPKNRELLNKWLGNQQQMGEKGTAMAGAGTKATFRDAPRLAKEYGGNPSDYAKMKSTVHTSTDGQTFRTHWVENTKTGQRFEYKIKLQEAPNK